MLSSALGGELITFIAFYKYETDNCIHSNMYIIETIVMTYSYHYLNVLYDPGSFFLETISILNMLKQLRHHIDQPVD